MFNLSLLSRGTGQVVRKKQEKFEVHFDPEDYLNWKSPETHCNDSRLLGNSQVLEGYWELYLPKTYSTKTGALVLYSEDLAKRSRKLKGYGRQQQRLGNKSRTLHIELRTLQDLVRAILAYGGKQAHTKGTAWQPYLHFLSDPEAIQASRQMRPGYSAKRYLLKLSQTLDPSILQKLQLAGYIRDPLLLEVDPSDHRKKQQDLSAVPPKYNLRILCSPCPHLPTEFEQPHSFACSADFDPSSHERSEYEAWVLEGYKRETHVRRRAQVPLRISVRKLSFQLTPQHSKEPMWRQNAVYQSVPEDTCMEVPQDGGNIKEHQGHSKMPHQSVDCPSLESTSIDTSELWCEKSHMTFYGGFFPGRKISCNVGQKHLKNPDCRERRPPVETGLFPPVQPCRSSGQGGKRKEHRKQVPEMFRLPQISEDSPKAQRKKLKSSELSKELVVLPLLVQLEREPYIKAKKPAGACCNELKSEVTLDDKLLAPLWNDIISEPENRNKQHQIINGRTPEAPLDSDLFTQDAVPSIGLLPTIDPSKYPGTKSNRDNFKTSTIINTGIGGKYKDLPAGITHREQRECSNGTSLSSLIIGPDREIVHPLLLGSVQATNDLGHWGFIPDEEGKDLKPVVVSYPKATDCTQKKENASVRNTVKLRHHRVDKEDGEVSLERRTISTNPPKNSAAAREPDGKEISDTLKDGSSTLGTNKRLETLKTQTGQVQENKNDLEDERNTTGNESSSSEFRQQRQDGDHGNCHLLQSKRKKRRSSLRQLESMGQKDGGDFIQGAGKQLDNLPPSEILSHLEPPLAHLTISSSDMERFPIPESDGGTLTEMPSHSETIKENTIGVHSSEDMFETEVEPTTLSKKTSKKAKTIRRHAAREVSENRPVSKQETHELAKTGAVSKPQKKSPKKDKRPSQAESVVGKPRQKKMTGKRTSYPMVKPVGVDIPVITEEPSQEENGEADAEVIPCLEGEGELGGTADQSPSPSSPPLKEEPSSPLEECQPPSEDAGNAFRSHASPANEMISVLQPVVPTTKSPQTDAVPSSEIPEVILENKQEAKLSRDRLIAERAEQRRLAVEKKRREQEELKRKQQEQQEQMERMKEEVEEEQRRRMEERRLRRQQREEESQRQEEEAARVFKAEKAAQERVRQQQEEQRRKFLEMQKKKQQEEKERAEAEKRRQKEREMQLEEERRLLAEMAEEERLEFEKRRREEEEEMRRLAEERRKKAEEEARLALEEARKQLESLARQRAELEEKQRTQYRLFVEATGLERGQAISRPWVYSYFQHPFLKTGDDD
ncbi:uncharacterized protein KIAA2012 homolog [Tiliqua scincoides]|uniref:uncharacterized protein KIAA2012 homolog n=1 Tax=Tiliqua scincoides TaxID=71010 RepID=UPI00346325F4